MWKPAFLKSGHTVCFTIGNHEVLVTKTTFIIQSNKTLVTLAFSCAIIGFNVIRHGATQNDF